MSVSSWFTDFRIPSAQEYASYVFITAGDLMNPDKVALTFNEDGTASARLLPHITLLTAFPNGEIKVLDSAGAEHVVSSISGTAVDGALPMFYNVDGSVSGLTSLSTQRYEMNSADIIRIASPIQGDITINSGLDDDRIEIGALATGNMNIYGSPGYDTVAFINDIAMTAGQSLTMHQCSEMIELANGINVDLTGGKLDGNLKAMPIIGNGNFSADLTHLTSLQSVTYMGDGDINITGVSKTLQMISLGNGNDTVNVGASDGSAPTSLSYIQTSNGDDTINLQVVPDNLRVNLGVGKDTVNITGKLAKGGALEIFDDGANDYPTQTTSLPATDSVNIATGSAAWLNGRDILIEGIEEINASQNNGSVYLDAANVTQATRSAGSTQYTGSAHGDTITNIGAPSSIATVNLGEGADTVGLAHTARDVAINAFGTGDKLDLSGMGIARTTDAATFAVEDAVASTLYMVAPGVDINSYTGITFAEGNSVAYFAKNGPNGTIIYAVTAEGGEDQAGPAIEVVAEINGAPLTTGNMVLGHALEDAVIISNGDFMNPDKATITVNEEAGTAKVTLAEGVTSLSGFPNGELRVTVDGKSYNVTQIEANPNCTQPLLYDVDNAVVVPDGQVLILDARTDLERGMITDTFRFSAPVQGDVQVRTMRGDDRIEVGAAATGNMNLYGYEDFDTTAFIEDITLTKGQSITLHQCSEQVEVLDGVSVDLTGGELNGNLKLMPIIGDGNFKADLSLLSILQSVNHSGHGNIELTGISASVNAITTGSGNDHIVVGTTGKTDPLSLSYLQSGDGEDIIDINSLPDSLFINLGGQADVVNINAILAEGASLTIFDDFNLDGSKIEDTVNLNTSGAAFITGDVVINGVENLNAAGNGGSVTVDAANVIQGQAARAAYPTVYTGSQHGDVIENAFAAGSSLHTIKLGAGADTIVAAADMGGTTTIEGFATGVDKVDFSAFSGGLVASATGFAVQAAVSDRLYIVDAGADINAGLAGISFADGNNIAYFLQNGPAGAVIHALQAVTNTVDGTEVASVEDVTIATFGVQLADGDIIA